MSDPTNVLVLWSRNYAIITRTQKAGRGYAEISWALLAEINLSWRQGILGQGLAPVTLDQ
jgi:hypothetical protein